MHSLSDMRWLMIANGSIKAPHTAMIETIFANSRVVVEEIEMSGTRAGGFAANPALAREACRKGGLISRRGPAKSPVEVEATSEQ